jgi:hypothetical protein
MKEHVSTTDLSTDPPSSSRAYTGPEETATFTIPKEPVRRVHGIETFNVLRGGEYFFMPSLSALKW